MLRPDTRPRPWRPGLSGALAGHRGPVPETTAQADAREKGPAVSAVLSLSRWAGSSASRAIGAFLLFSLPFPTARRGSFPPGPFRRFLNGKA